MLKQSFVNGLFVGMLFVPVACGADDATDPDPEVEIASVRVTAASIAPRVHDTVQLQAEALDESGTVLDEHDQAVWSSDDQSVATVSVAGLVTALDEGSVTISATIEGRSGTVDLTVGPALVSRVEVSGASTPLVPGQVAELTAHAYDSHDILLDGRAVIWSVSNASTATVDGTGNVTAHATGTTQVQATVEGVSGSTTVSVTEGFIMEPAGGTYLLRDGTLRIVAAPGAVSTPTPIQVGTHTQHFVDPSLVLGSNVDLIGPGNVQFAASVLLTLPYDTAAMPRGVPEADLKLHVLHNGSLNAIPDATVDEDENTVTGTITRTGTFFARRAPSSVACTAPEYRQFDFWVGEWSVGPANQSSITAEPSGCAIFEHWMTISGATAGRSISVYDPTDQQWHQTYMFQVPVPPAKISGGLVEDGLMVMYMHDQAGQIVTRWTWTELDAERVRQQAENSPDNGATWLPGFDAVYTRKP